MRMRFFLLLLLPFWWCTGSVKAEYFIIKQYHITVTFSPEGQADFEERIEVEFFEPRHGIFRTIPVRSIIDGKRVDRIFKDVHVEGFKSSTSRENNNFIIKIGDPDVYVSGNQVYTIHYRVVNPFNFFKENIEFYWDLLGISWPVAVENFSYKLLFPPQVNLGQGDARFFTGQEGAGQQDATFNIKPREISGSTIRIFPPREGLTVAVQFPPDTFKALSSWQLFWQKHSLLFAPIFFLLSGVIALLFARNKKQPVMTEYFPPDGLSPAIAGGFVDHSVDNSDVLSLIPHLANLGYLRLESEKGGFLQKNNIIFYKLKEAGDELYAFEKDFFNALFATGDRVELKHLRDKFYTHMSSVRSSVKSWIKDQGWYESDQQKMGCITGFLGLVAIGWGAYAIFARQNMDGIALVLSGVVLFIFAGRFNKRSAAGNQTYQKLEGFRQFVKKAERPVIERLMKDDPLYYDKTMPFALAFGYLKKWNRHFDGLLSQPPSWYSSPMMYGTDLNRSWSTFSESFPSEINTIGSVFSSSPSSSSSGGGGGGGSSGGGSGGGGGGSW